MESVWKAAIRLSGRDRRLTQDRAGRGRTEAFARSSHETGGLMSSRLVALDLYLRLREKPRLARAGSVVAARARMERVTRLVPLPRGLAVAEATLAGRAAVRIAPPPGGGHAALAARRRLLPRLAPHPRAAGRGAGGARRGRGGAAATTGWRPSTPFRRRSTTPAPPGTRSSPRAGRPGGSRSAATAPAAGSPSRCSPGCSPRGSRRRRSSPSARGSTCRCRAPATGRLARRDALLPAERLREVRDLYLAGADPADPRASPHRAAFPGAPPVLVQASRGRDPRRRRADDRQAAAGRGRAGYARPRRRGAARLAVLARLPARGRRGDGPGGGVPAPGRCRAGACDPAVAGVRRGWRRRRRRARPRGPLPSRSGGRGRCGRCPRRRRRTPSPRRPRRSARRPAGR